MQMRTTLNDLSSKVDL